MWRTEYNLRQIQTTCHTNKFFWSITRHLLLWFTQCSLNIIIANWHSKGSFISLEAGCRYRWQLLPSFILNFIHTQSWHGGKTHFCILCSSHNEGKIAYPIKAKHSASVCPSETKSSRIREKQLVHLNAVQYHPFWAQRQACLKSWPLLKRLALAECSFNMLLILCPSRKSLQF